MDINGQHYFLLKEPNEFSNRSTRFLWNPQRKALTLAQNQELRLPQNNITAALESWDAAIAVAQDSYGQISRVAGNRIEYNSGRGFLPLVDDKLTPVETEVGDFSDISIGGDDFLAGVYSNNADIHGAMLFHLRQRWYTRCSIPEPARRVCIDQKDRVWCMSEAFLYVCEGAPLPHGYESSATRFEPISINPNEFSLVAQIELSGTDIPLAICTDVDSVYVLVHDGEGSQTVLSRSLNLTNEDWIRYPLDIECPFAADMKVLGENRFALLVPAESDDEAFVRRDCAVIQLEVIDDDRSATLIRERYPMLSQAGTRFVSTADEKVRYQALVQEDSEEEKAGFTMHPRDLLALQRPRFYVSAMATLLRHLDSGTPDTNWHRIYLEGCIPTGCRVVVYAKTYNNPADQSSTPYVEQPQWVWCRHRSDVGFGKGIVESNENKSGLFELLLQRNKGPVRRMTGRYLKLRIRLEGDGRNTPAIHALKIYYPRFSYQEAYLPEHFRQELAVDPQLDDLRANGADVRERLLSAFEGALTPIETLIASSEVLLNPNSSPVEHLPWLAELFGQNIPGSWPESRKRRWIESTGDLQKCRGTLAGVQLALDIITDGAVQRGEIVIVENFRLRRTMATILGLSMDDVDHPLTLGTGVSGNSIVGDSLILSDSNAREFLALFAPKLAEAGGSAQNDAEIVEEFFDKYAHKVTVLLHGKAKRLRIAVEEMLQQQMPAHLQWQLVETDHPFVLGLSPLLSVDTYLENRPPARRVTLNDTYLGAEGVLANIAAFSPQDVNRRTD